MDIYFGLELRFILACWNRPPQSNELRNMLLSVKGLHATDYVVLNFTLE